MDRKGLFEDLPETELPAERVLQGKPRLREPVRDQIELRAVDLESLIGSDHPARLIWAYVEKLDLSMLEDAIKAREGRPGYPPITPRLMMGLWLYATSQGVGSARVLEHLCESEDAYRWMCGGVSVNYHTLSDFRTSQGELLDRLLAENVAALASAGVIDLSSLTQDGIKVRAAAGAASFRRRKTLEHHLEIARALVEELKREVDEDPAASSKRARAAHERAARERLARVQSALQQLGEVEALRKKRAMTNRKETEKQKEPRASTTDPQVRNLKMADGGFRPAYNVQVVSVAGEQIVVAVDPVTTGSDRGQIAAMLDQIPSRTGQVPQRYLADGGFTKAEDIERAHGEKIAVYCPPIRSKHGGDPYAPHRKDGPGVLAWRARMASEYGQAFYKLRSLCECIHGRWRNWNIRLTVRGRLKVKAAMLWNALANNILQGHRLMQATA
jgi:transposase